MTQTPPIIRLENITKTFGNVVANSDVCLDLAQGQILALLGENGAGKSTLMSILAGQLQPDAGTIFHNGDRVRLSSTEKAIEAGIGMVYQHFKLVEAMTVTENIFLGQGGNFWLHKEKMNETVRQLAEKYSMEIDPESLVADLSMGEKQQVEILKLLQRQSTILIFDEPTAVLTPREANVLFETMRSMARQGKSIVFISHKLEEVMAIADGVAILRRGRIIDQIERDDIHSTVDLANRMVGREVLLRVDKTPLEPRQPVLQVEELTHNSSGPAVSLVLRQGEILAIVGVAGNGQKPLVETVCGLKPPHSGNVSILGRDWPAFFSSQNWDQTLSYIPEDRQGLATCQNLDLLDNFLLTTRGGFVHGPWLGRQSAKEKATKLIEDFDIRPPTLEALAWQLSGGNLQKLVLAREFYRRPRLIVAEQPTQGLDIAAAEDVWNLLLKAREQAGILLITGDLSEALALSDRLAVMYNGAIVETFASDDRGKVGQIPEMMAGLYTPTSPSA